jgi:glycosyltransferase involved in cell wall biosynthesis
MDLISIIVPVYNVEHYLERCLNSIIKQTYSNIEIIIINDGSKDNSLEVCQRYQQKDNRIRIISKKNEGVSVARNIGIKEASGKYIGFVDSDDWIEPEMYESMYNTIIKHNCSIAFCNYSKDSKFTNSPKLLKTNKEVLEKIDIIKDLICNMIGINDILPKYYNVMGSVWRCLYKKEFIEKFNLSFRPDIQMMEDLIFNIEALIYCDRACIDHGVWYHYMQNKTSYLHSYIENMWIDQIKVHNIIESIINDAALDEYMRNRLDSRYIAMAACSFGNEIYRSDAPLKDRMAAAKKILDDEKLKIVLERTKQYNLENIRYLKDKDKVDTENENKIIKKLLKFINHEK